MKRTSIGWTDWSSNPVKYRDRETGKVVWSCVKVADECTNCYAEALGLRWGKGHPFTKPNLALVEPFLDAKEIRTLLRSKLIAGQRLFLGDMTDIFGSWVPDAWLDQIFAVFAIRRDVTWQILTKRPARMAEYLNYDDRTSGIKVAISRLLDAVDVAPPDGWYREPEQQQFHSTGAYLGTDAAYWDGDLDWPLPNVIGGTSAGSQRTADLFIPGLLRANLAYRSISVEPLIAPINLFGYDEDEGALRGPAVVISGGTTPNTADFPSEGYDDSYPGIDWVIVGGESGAGYRPMELDWLRKVVEDSQAAGVPVFVKQDAHRQPERRGRIPDDLWIQQFPTIGAGATS